MPYRVQFLSAIGSIILFFGLAMVGGLDILPVQFRTLGLGITCILGGGLLIVLPTLAWVVEKIRSGTRAQQERNE